MSATSPLIPVAAQGTAQIVLIITVIDMVGGIMDNIILMVVSLAATMEAVVRKSKIHVREYRRREVPHYE